METKATDPPRRFRLDQFSPAERAIWDAMQAVESLPADVRLTDAVVLLQAARECVADYVDGVEKRHPQFVHDLHYLTDYDVLLEARKRPSLMSSRSTHLSSGR